MWPAFFDMQNLVFDGSYFTLGALADSLYEYLPKMHALICDVDPVYQTLAKDSPATIKKHILFRPMLPDKADILFAGEVRVGKDGRLSVDAEG
jgi:mannosyl-oligosaccharide alpha-1,2-mannosidase